MLVPALVAVLALAGAPSLSASAFDSDYASDPGGDVVSGPKQSDAPPKHPEPDRSLGDIVGVSVEYDEALVVTTRYRDLEAQGYQEHSWTFLTANAEASYETWTATLVTRPGRNTGKLTLLDPIANQPRCGRAVLDRDEGTSTLTIPATCLGNPAWVRVGNGVDVRIGPARFADDARRDGKVSPRGWRLGPKVERPESE